MNADSQGSLNCDSTSVDLAVEVFSMLADVVLLIIAVASSVAATSFAIAQRLRTRSEERAPSPTGSPLA